MMNEAELKRRLQDAKEFGFSDRQLAHLWGSTEEKIRALRQRLGVEPVYKTVDTCAAEFEAYTPYHYSTYESESEVSPCEREKIIILGGGPNRIGQGIEFDYCCVHAVFALSEMGYETIMVNSNPETVSTDYDTADRLYFEPLTFEDVMNIIETEKPKGVIVQFGGQTPLKLAVPLENAGVTILGTSPDSIDLAEDRKRFGALIDQLGIKQPPNGTAVSVEEAIAIANKITYPVLVRPSYVLGGRAMEIVYDETSLANYMERAVEASPERPVLVDKFLEDAVEVDVDAISDGESVYIGGIMEHIEFAGVHSGDSACVIPPRTLKPSTIDDIVEQTKMLARALKVCGLMNIQYAVSRRGGEEVVSVLEVNPRASRTVPYVSKAKGVPLAKIAAQVMAGKPLKEFNLPERIEVKHVAVKEAVLPFVKFPGVDTILGPEMRSTGEVMGIDTDFGRAYAKAQAGAGMILPGPNPPKEKSQIIISVNDHDKPEFLPIAAELARLNFELFATGGTFDYLKENGVECQRVFKVKEDRPNIVDLMKNGRIALVINTPLDRESAYDELALRRCAVEQNVPYVTTRAGAQAALAAIQSDLKNNLQVKALQDYFQTASA
ncbi:MAG: carbamoyl-phosphate synthase large subunit [bacterium]|nr:carbamoyl-phosphate synthase large subunit [bacterium]